jgi:S1-C subfamily serine protease
VKPFALPAEQSGLRVNDIVTGVNGTAVGSGGEWNRLVTSLKNQTAYPVTVYRDGQTIDITLKGAAGITGQFVRPQGP